jgi:curved DNA-binding protein CbpA
VTSDCYSILGVTPAAEDVVIGAAYRALMRHYHPDTNPDPKAQERVREITAAYAVLRDPAKRAQYDAGRGLWADPEEVQEPAPPLRTAGIASAVLALLLAGTLWAWQGNDQPARKSTIPAAAEQPRSTRSPPAAAVEQLQPETQRLADMRAEADPLPPVAPPAPAPPPAETEPALPPLLQPAVAKARPAPVAKPKRILPETVPLQVAPKAKLAAPAPAQPAQAQRLATLNRISAGFFGQSMVHASDAKKELLLAARDRSAADRKACHTDSCVADAYLRQIRETSAIMEKVAEPKK